MRLAFTVYTAISGNSWQDITIDKINFDVNDLRNRLLPVLQQSILPNTSYKDIKLWANRIVEECKTSLLQTVLPFTEAEQEFLEKIERWETINLSLLSKDEKLISRIQQHPALQWRILRKK